MTIPFNTDLSGKVAVVTGGSGVLGSVLSEALAEAGAKVAVLARTQSKIDRVVESIKSKGHEAIGYSVDVLNKDDLKRVREDLKEQFGTCDILINGAGGNDPKATTSHDYFTEDDGEQSFLI